MKKNRIIGICIMIMMLSFVKLNAQMQTWASVGNGLNGSVNSMIEFNGKLYAGYGSYTSNNFYLSCWDGAVWNTVIAFDTNNSGYSAGILCMVVYQGELIVAGTFDNIGGISAHCIAKYDGSNWSSVGGAVFTNQNLFSEPQINNMTVSNGNLYVGGTFDSLNNVEYNSIALWNGNNWQPLDTMLLPNSVVQGMCFYNGALCMGILQPSLNSWQIVKHDTTGLNSIGVLGGNAISSNSLTVFDGKMYFSGYFSTIDSNNIIDFAVWDGSSWSQFGNGIMFDSTNWGIPGGVANSMIVKDGSLYIAGNFKYLNGVTVNNIARYDGVTVYSIDIGNIVPYSNLSTVCTYNGTICVGGQFDSIGSVNSHNIAILNKQITTSSQNLEPDSFCIYPNPFTESININFHNDESHQIEITDILGKKVFQIKQNGNTQISTEKLGPGMYFVSIITENKKSVAVKIIKQ